MVYNIVKLSSTASTVKNKHQAMNLSFTIFFGWSEGWTLSCMTLNSSRNTHSSSCSCWKSSAYDTGVFKGIHHWKNRHVSFGQHWKSLYRFSFRLSEIFTLAFKPQKQLQFRNRRPSSRSSCIVSAICKKQARSVLIYTLQNVINTIKQPFQHGIHSCSKQLMLSISLYAANIWKES